MSYSNNRVGLFGYAPDAFTAVYGEQIAKKEGRAYKHGIMFDQGIDQGTADDFFGKLGVHHPTGAAQPKPINPGVRLNQGEYVVTGGSGGQSDWTNYDPSDGATKYKKIANYGGGMIWKRDAAPAPAPATPAPEAPKERPTLDTSGIERAKNLVEAYKAGNGSGSGRNFVATSDPYADARNQGMGYGEDFSRFIGGRDLESGLQTAEISAAGQKAIKDLEFFGVKVPTLKSDQQIRDQFGYYRDQIKNA